MTKVLKLYFNRLHQLDPTCDALIRALKCTIPGIIGMICWICFKKPFTFWIILLPVLSIYVISYASTYRQKYLNLFTFLLFIGVIQFGASILYNYSVVLIAFFFVASFIAVSTFKYRYGAVMALLVVVPDLPQNWYDGVNRIIEIVIAGVISSLLIIIYEYVFTKKILRYTIIYFFELLWDSYQISTESELKVDSLNIKNKYLFERPISVKVDFKIEKIFKTDRERFAHRIIMEIINKGKNIDIEKYIFKKNKSYWDYIYPIYILTREVVRSITYMLNFNNHKIEIYKLCPTTPLLLQNMNDAFNKMILFLKKDQKVDFFLEKKLIQKWNKELEEAIHLEKDEIGDEILESIYGIKCLILDFNKFETISQANQGLL